MAQWTAKGLSVLILSFGIFLVSFNLSGIPFSQKKISIPFQINEKMYRQTISNVSFFNYPLTIKAIPPIKKYSKLSVWCGLASFKDEINISFAKDYNIGYSFTKCPNVTVELSNIQENTSLWLQINVLESSMILEIVQYVLFSTLLLTFVLFYIKRKAASTQRSTIVIILSSLFMMDPFSCFTQLISFPEVINRYFSLFGLWRMSSELFAEYSPLVRQNQKYYKILCLIPSLFLILIFNFPYYLFSNPVVTLFGNLIGLIVPGLAMNFLFMAGNTTGKFALIIQIMTGALVVSAEYYITYYCFTDTFYDSSFLIRLFEYSMISCYAFFQTIIKSGEMVEEEAMSHLPHSNVRRYDKIDEILNDLVAEDDIVKFEEEM